MAETGAETEKPRKEEGESYLTLTNTFMNIADNLTHTLCCALNRIVNILRYIAFL